MHLGLARVMIIDVVDTTVVGIGHISEHLLQHDPSVVKLSVAFNSMTIMNCCVGEIPKHDLINWTGNCTFGKCSVTEYSR